MTTPEGRRGLTARLGERETANADYTALLWMVEGWSDEPLRHLGVVADPADDPETARKEAEREMSRLRQPEAGGMNRSDGLGS